MYIENSVFIAKGESGEYVKYSIDGLRHLSFWAAVKLENKLWVSNNRFNGLFIIDLDTGAISFCGHFPNVPIDAKCLHKCAFFYKDTIYFFPQYAIAIWGYNIITQEFSYYPMYKTFSTQKYIRTNGITFYDNSIYIFSESLEHPIYKFELETKAITEMYILQEQCIKKNLKMKEIICKGFVEKQENVYMVLNESNVIYKFDIKKEECTFFQLEDNDIQLSGLAWDGKDFICVDSFRGELVYWNEFSGLSKKLELKKDSEKKLEIIRLLVIDDTIILIEHNGKIRKIRQGIESILMEKDAFIKDFVEEWGFSISSGYLIEDNSLYIFPLRGIYIYILNILSGKIMKFEPLIESIPVIFTEMFECETNKIGDFIHIINSNMYKTSLLKEEETGTKIYSSIWGN